MNYGDYLLAAMEKIAAAGYLSSAESIRWYALASLDGALTLKSKEMLLAPTQSEWSGEGDPPVGTTCEWHPSSDQVIVVTILGRDGDETWFRRKGEELSETCLRMAFFSPIRTPEQIALEERSHAISEMSTMIGGPHCRMTITEILETLHDAGYRKQVAP